nr:hypothetical protein pPsy0462a_00075 [Pseudomonas syringae]
MQHVLVSLPGRDDGPSMVFNAITPEGLLPIGTGNGINRSGGEPVSREHIAFKLEGDSAVRIGKLDAPGEVPPTLHALLGFDQRWKRKTPSQSQLPQRHRQHSRAIHARCKTQTAKELIMKKKHVRCTADGRVLPARCGKRSGVPLRTSGQCGQSDCV